MTNLEALGNLHRSLNRLRQITQTLDFADLAKTEGASQMLEPKVANLIAEFDQATNDIAARLERISQSQGLSEEGAAALEGEVQKLRALGANPANPIPTTTTTTGSAGETVGAGSPLSSGGIANTGGSSSGD